MISDIDNQFDISLYNVKFVDDSLYSELADNTICIIRINGLDYKWEEAGSIALYKDELRISSNLDDISDSKCTVSQQDGITTEQVKLILHVMEENRDLQIYISSTYINNIQSYLFNTTV